MTKEAVENIPNNAVLLIMTDITVGIHRWGEEKMSIIDLLEQAANIILKEKIAALREQEKGNGAPLTQQQVVEFLLTHLMLKKEDPWKPTIKENPAYVCRVCKSPDVWYRDISIDYDDREYHCRGCNRRWVYEGSDY